MTRRINLLIILGWLGLLAVGCSADQLNRADRAVGGSGLQPVTLPSGATTQPTATAAAANLVHDAADRGASIANAIPLPWATAVAGVLGIVSVLAGAVARNQSNRAALAESAIAAAAPAVSKSLEGPIGKLEQLALQKLLNHPAAKG